MPGQPQCGLRLLKTVKSSLRLSPLRRVKRPHAATQMKRVQRANGSLAQSGARSPSVLPAENIAKLMRSRKSALPPRRRLRSPRPFVLRRDRRQKTRKPEVNQQSPITTRHPRTHEWRSRPTAEQERNISQAVLFGAQAANSRRDRTQNATIEPYIGREPRASAATELHRRADQFRVPTTPDNRANITRTHEWRSRPGGIETQHSASRPVCQKTNSRRDRTQNAAIEPYTGREPSAKRRNRTAYRAYTKHKTPQ